MGHQYYPGDAEYMTPELMKAWMMQESGGSPDAFKTDPFQVNNPGDRDPAKANKNFAGSSQGQTMTPQTSADAALKWFHYKGRIDTGENSPTRGQWVPYQVTMKRYETIMPRQAPFLVSPMARTMLILC